MAPIAAAALVLALGPAQALEPPPVRAAQRVLGEVTAIDAAGRRINLKTDAGESIAVVADDQTAFLRAQPGAGHAVLQPVVVAGAPRPGTPAASRAASSRPRRNIVVLAGTKSVALCHVQELLGARDSETTEAYTHAPLVYTIRRPHLRESERSRRMLPNRY